MTTKVSTLPAGRVTPAWTAPALRYPRASYANTIEAVDRVLAAEAIHFAPSVRRYLYAPPPRDPTERVLDVGCGEGQGCVVLHRLGWRRIAALDAQPSIDASVRHLGVQFRHAVAEHYHPNAPFDLLTCCDALEHTTNPRLVLRRMVGWLSQNGLLYLTVPLEGEISRNPYHLNVWSKARLHLQLAEHWRVVRDGMLGVNEYWAWLVPKGRLTWWETGGTFHATEGGAT